MSHNRRELLLLRVSKIREKKENMRKDAPAGI
jgi:hypothetical protein